MVGCRLEAGLREKQSCVMESLNETFNFSLNEAVTILLEHQQSDSNVDPITEAILIVLYVCLIISGVAANLLISVVVVRKPHLHSAKNLYVVNLTVSDLTLCLICMPFTLVSLIRKQWSLGTVFCKAVPALQGTNIMVSIGTITVIALDRYITIVRGHHDTRSSKNRVIWSIILVWLLSFAATLPVVIYQEVEALTLHDLVLYEACIERWPSLKMKISYAVALLLLQAIIPVLVVSLVHARIAAHLHAHAKTQKDSRRAQRELSRNRRTTFLLTGVAVVFGVSWVPLGLFSLVTDLVSLPPRTLYIGLAVCHILAMSSALSNPVIYGWFNTNIRAELIQLLPKSLRERFDRPSRQHADEPSTKTAGITRTVPLTKSRASPPQDAVTYTAL